MFVNEAGELEQQECVIYGVSIYSDDMYLEVMRYVFVQGNEGQFWTGRVM